MTDLYWAEAHTRPAWMSKGCHDPGSCFKHGRCMYVGCEAFEAQKPVVKIPELTADQAECMDKIQAAKDTYDPTEMLGGSSVPQGPDAAVVERVARELEPYLDSMLAPSARRQAPLDALGSLKPGDGLGGGNMVVDWECELILREAEREVASYKAADRMRAMCANIAGQLPGYGDDEAYLRGYGRAIKDYQHFIRALEWPE